MQEKQRPSGDSRPAQEQGPDLKAELAKLAFDAPPEPLHAGARLRNYFLTGLVVVGPVTITLYIAWYFINIVDAWVKPYIPKIYNPESYLPFPVPGRRPGVRDHRPHADRRACRQPARALADQRRRADGRAHADRAQRLPGPQADLRVGGDGVDAEPELPEGRPDGVSLQGHLVARVRDRRCGRADLRRDPGHGPHQRVHADGHAAALGLRVLRAAHDRGAGQDERGGRGQDHHLGRHGEPRDPGAVQGDGAQWRPQRRQARRAAHVAAAASPQPPAGHVSGCRSRGRLARSLKLRVANECPSRANP